MEKVPIKSHGANEVSWRC